MYVCVYACLYHVSMLFCTCARMFVCMCVCIFVLSSRVVSCRVGSCIVSSVRMCCVWFLLVFIMLFGHFTCSNIFQSGVSNMLPLGHHRISFTL